MDRPLDSAQKIRRWLRGSAIVAIVGATIVGALALSRTLLTPGLRRADIRTAVVDSGSIESVMSASGIVVPEVEQVVSSPIDARVVKILRRAGDSLRAGDPIVELDTSATALSIQKIDQDIALKANAQASVRLDLQKTLDDLASQVAAKHLDLDSLIARLEQDRRLGASGLTSASAVRDAELAVAKARIEVAQLEAQMANAKESTKTRIEGLTLEMETLSKERVEATKLLSLATMKADRDGVLTWVVTEEGSTVARGALIARIADLHSFRVDATLSDVHSQDVAAGLPVKVKLGDELVEGRVTGVLPTIQNGILTVNVGLSNAADSRLKANLRVDVYVVTAHRDRALRIRKGPFANAGGSREVFVIHGDRAVRTPVELGIGGVDDYEVVSGLSEGDEVIISDVHELERAREIAIR